MNSVAKTSKCTCNDSDLEDGIICRSCADAAEAFEDRALAEELKAWEAKERARLGDAGFERLQEEAADADEAAYLRRQEGR